MTFSNELQGKTRMAQRTRTIVAVGAVFLAFFVLGPLAHLRFFHLMPGDLGDARLNNYFLENTYQFLLGRSASLWHLGFFAPFPYVLGFSDNLFGSAPVYVLARFLTGEPDTAFQLWFLVGYGLNFLAAFYALGRLGAGPVAASVGAAVFAFALPTTAHAGHAQLHYRFGVPLAAACFVGFLERRQFRDLLAAMAWLVWQFYCGIYMGFFTMLMLGIIAFAFLLHVRWVLKNTLRSTLMAFVEGWRAQSATIQGMQAVGLCLLIGALGILFYPYWKVTQLYGVTRPWWEVARMLPRIQSYFLSDYSWLWAFPKARLFAHLPMRWEHQMFMGAVPMALALFGWFAGDRTKNPQSFFLMTGAVVGMVGLTLSVGPWSLWALLHKLPLFSAIRAVTRLDQVLLFPVGYFGALGVEKMKRLRAPWGGVVVGILVILMLGEFSATSLPAKAKKEWRDRLAAKAAMMPENVSRDHLVFFAQSAEPWHEEELDAMWVCLLRGVKTLNGYSGVFPRGYRLVYGKDCSEVPRRVAAYVKFVGHEKNPHVFWGLLGRVIPIGFENCPPEWGVREK